jgi:FdhD protein
MNPVSTISTSIVRYENGRLQNLDDQLAIEEPLEIKMKYLSEGRQIEKNVSITMRTPGNDDELACGFLFTEGIIRNSDDIKGATQYSENSISIELNENIKPIENKLERNFYTTSSCGVCGKASIDAIATVSNYKINNRFQKVDPAILVSLPEKLSKQQEIFKSTGGLHASALFDHSGSFIDLREDVGRHNALDKLIGSMLLKKTMPLDDTILLLSGRASFELIQKASMAGIPVVVAIGAPSSLAVDLAKESGITLIGFLRGEKYNLYS